MAYITINNDDKFKKLLNDIFTDEFMRQCTNFESFEYFKYSSAVIANWEAEKMVYDEKLLDMFVNESTRFSSFDEMVRTASDRRFKQKTNQTGENDE